MVQTTGYAAAGDYGAARYIAIDAPDPDWDWMQARDRWMIETANGRWFMLDPSQIIHPEMFGAVGDATHFPGILSKSVYYSDDPTIWVSDYYAGPGLTGSPTDDWEAGRAMFDYVTWLGGGVVVDDRPGAIYWWADPRKSVNGSNTKYQCKRRDGLLVERIEDYDDGYATGAPKWNMALDGVKGFTWRGNGSRWVQAPYHIPEAGHIASGSEAGDPRWHARGIRLYKCEGLTFDKIRIDMNWRRHTSWSGRGFQRNDWGWKVTACRNVLWDMCEVHDSPHDGYYIQHRFITNVGGMAGPLDEDLSYTATTDSEWTGDTPVPKLYWPHGENENLVFRNCRVSNCARQAMSIIGGRSIYIEGGRWTGTQRYLGTAPINTVGAAAHGLANYRLPRLSPGCWIDAEPNREHPRSVEFVTVVGARVADNFSMWGATGQGDFTRVENSFTSAEVDTGANTITITNHLLPAAILLQNLRLYNAGGALPGGLERYTDYWLHRIGDTDAFTLHRARADGVSGANPVNLTSGGSGTHYIAVGRAKSQVENVRLIGCDFDHPADGGDPFPGETTALTVEGGRIFNRSRTRAMGDNGAHRNEVRLKNVDLVSYASGINSEDTTKGETVTADDAADTINGTGLQLDPYYFTPVRFASTGDLPAPLLRNVDYFATYVTDDQCKLSVSEEAARAGTYINLTTTGSGTITMYQQRSWWDWDGGKHVWTVPPGFEFDALADVDLAANTINFPDAHEFGARGEDRCQFRPHAGASLPTPLVAGTAYYPVAVDETRIIVCANGADASANPPVPIDLTVAGSGYCRVCPTGNRAILINQRGTLNNIEFFFDRRIYPIGASSVDAVVVRRSGEMRNCHFRTDLPAGEGVFYLDLDRSSQVLVDTLSFMANGTTQMKQHTTSQIAYTRPRQAFRVWWDTDANQTFNPRTDGVGAALNVPITANRTFTLSTTGAFEGQECTIYRTANATGSFTFSGGGATLSNPGEGARFEFKAGAWIFMGAA